MISKLKEIAEALNIFHDGKLVLVTDDNNFWKFEILIPYLAKVIDPSFSKFYVQIDTSVAPYYYPWKKEAESMQELNILSMFLPKILSADLNSFNQVEWQLEMTNHVAPVYEGGILVVQPVTLNVYDEEFNRLDLEKLKLIRKKYLQTVTKS